MRIQLALSLSVFALQFAFLGLPAKAQTPTTVAGSTPGQFSVSESGAATYRIPIQVPPGVAGMQPKLELVYNSQGGNGLLGMGWSLSGLSAITRCPRTMASDGVRGSVNFDLNDRYCLDGQRLMLVAGSYGADGSEYRTERESFSKILAYGAVGTGPQYFVVKTKAGLTMEYGNTEDSRALNQPGTVVRAWAINKILDVKTNRINFYYYKSADNSIQVATDIVYGGNDLSGTANSFAVSFGYDTNRSDKSLGYVAGSLVQTNWRMTSIITNSSGSQHKNYRITYQNNPSPYRSRISSVSECLPSNNGCQTPISLVWPENERHFVAAPSFNYQSGASVPTYAEGNRIWFVDVNGDGLADHVLRNSAGVITVALSTGTSFVAAPSFNYQSGSDPTIYAEANRIWFVDVNGDGLADHVLRDSTGGINVAMVSPTGELANRVKNISNQTTAAIEYRALTNGTVYTKDSAPNAAVYPKIDLQYPLYVVNKVEQSNGVGGVVATEYKYGGLKAELGTGRGLLGFRWMSAKNLATGIESYTEYRQDWPYTGIPLKNETRLTGAGNGGVLKRSSTTVACQIPQTAAACTVAAGNRYFPYVAQSVEESWDLGGLPYPSITSSYVYGQSPQYGDPTQITVGTSDGASKTTVNEYWPVDTSNWILGRLRRATVTSSKP